MLNRLHHPKANEGQIVYNPTGCSLDNGMLYKRPPIFGIEFPHPHCHLYTAFIALLEQNWIAH